MPSRLTWLIRNKIEKRSCFGGFFFYGGNYSILGLKAASGVGLTALRAEAGCGARIGAAVFPKVPAPSAQRGVWHPSGLPALGAKGCIKGLRRFAQGKRPWLAPLKKKGRPYDKTIQPPCGRRENKPTALRAKGKQANRPASEGNAPLLPPAAAPPPAGEILATLCIEMLLGEMVPCGVLSHRFCGGKVVP